MSDLTKAALERAIFEHFQSETEGGLVTHWLVQMGGIHSEQQNMSRTYWDVPNDQPFYVTLGLIETLKRSTSPVQRATLEGPMLHDDDESDD